MGVKEFQKFLTGKANDNISIYVAMELLNDNLENFVRAQSEDQKVISQRLSSHGSRMARVLD